MIIKKLRDFSVESIWWCWRSIDWSQFS